MQCPKCQNDMETISYENIEVDRCTFCQGIWFDALEHEHLKAIQGSESIDIGGRDIGREFNDVTQIECPTCHTDMIRMVDRDQPHIRYEACTVCYGVFFDAGEFRDYKSKTVLDFFRDLLAGERN